jgi:hypothetical protein
MSANRADFVSRLFSRRLTSSVATNAPVERIFAALEYRSDGQLFSQSLQEIKTRLQKIPGFPLSQQDLRTIDYIFDAFRGGPDYALTTFGTSYRLLMQYT